MGNKDIATKKYMSDNVRFADVFNYAIYGGRQIIKHDMLKEISAEELLLMEGDKEKLMISSWDSRKSTASWVRTELVRAL